MIYTEAGRPRRICPSFREAQPFPFASLLVPLLLRGKLARRSASTPLSRLPKEALGGGTAEPRDFCRTPGGKGCKGCRLAGSLQVVLRASGLASHAQRSHGFGQEEVSAVPSGSLREVQEHQPGCHDQVPVRFSSRGEVALEACPGM